MDMGLSGVTVLITGGSGGVGRGLVSGFAREGANVVNADIDSGKPFDTVPGDGAIIHIPVDITDRRSVAQMVAATLKAFGTIDVLVNNAGGGTPPKPFELFEEADRQHEVALNVDGIVHVTQLASADMLARGKGSIINISSLAGVLGEASRNHVHYGAVKGFVISFTRALAFEWGRRGIRINTIAPGLILPEQREALGPSSVWTRFGDQLQASEEEVAAAIREGRLSSLNTLPIARAGRPSDIADLALFLASDRSSYITGQMIAVGGGSYMP